jgi:hypothetical protein
MLVQIILIAIVAIMLIRLVFKRKSREINNNYFVIWLIIWLLAMLLILFPDIASYFADTVGVGRGVDLIIYISIIAIFYLQFKLLMRIEKLEKDITHITRHLAIKGTGATNNDNDQS